jgi:hypothetical protein
MLGGAYVGSKMAAGRTPEQPLWNGHVGNDPSMPAVAITSLRWRGQLYYRLYIADEGDYAMVGQSTVYAEILAMIQVWERYLTQGGTLNAWRVENARRQEEATGLEHSFAQEATPEPEPQPVPPTWEYKPHGFIAGADGIEDNR